MADATQPSNRASKPVSRIDHVQADGTSVWTFEPDPARPDLAADHPLAPLATLLDDDRRTDGLDGRFGGHLAEIGTARLAEIIVMATGLLDPDDARAALAESLSLLRTMDTLRSIGQDHQ